MTPQALIAPARLAGAPLLRAQSDERLVDLVRAGNDAAFEAIVARYRKPLLRYCTRFLGEPRAEDVVQQALVSAYSSLRSSHGDMSLRPWLYRIVHNTALNALRDRALRHEELSESLDGVDRPDQLAESGERFRDVMGAVAALPERQRDAIVLREMEGRSYEAIAAELGVSDGAVRQLLNRARNTLRTGMAAVTPFGLLARVPLSGGNGGTGEVVAARVAELAGAGAGATVLTKVAATALVTGAVIGGVAGSPGGGLEDGGAREDGQPAAAGAAGGGPDTRTAAGADESVDADEEPALRGGEQAGEDRRGRGSGRGRGHDRDDREDNSGPGSADDRDDDDSGHGRGRSGGDERDTDIEPEEDSSGSGSGSDSTRSGSD
ncbi:MAG TPA: sigma-70 family RNA polymerase sigma factor [Thermoleophilaceae bacterium]|nr:sigma-70 family RNA polymerase sigma factor [Thermoleophilaceae bacterium]